jgi:hypothetical protein
MLLLKSASDPACAPAAAGRTRKLETKLSARLALVEKQAGLKAQSPAEGKLINFWGDILTMPRRDKEQLTPAQCHLQQ